jgi:hypothetical protein
MTKKIIDIGVLGNDGTGDSIRESFRKVNENFNELYSIFGLDANINLTDLRDTPTEYITNENRVLVVRPDAQGIIFSEFASNNALNGATDTIGFDFSQPGKIIATVDSIKVEQDLSPRLSGPMDAQLHAIANVAFDISAVSNLNAIHNTNFQLRDLVVNWGYVEDYINAGITTNIFGENGTLLVDSDNNTIPSAVLSGTEVDNWNDAYSWGDHALVGYLLETTFNNSPAGGITSTQVSNWDDAYSWGDHALAGYLLETTFNNSPAGGITSTQVSNWDDAYSWGDHALVGYLLASDYAADPASGITSTQVSNWDDAYSWGDHALVGYLTQNSVIYGDFVGSVYSDDSTLLIDGINGVIPGYVHINLLKQLAGDSDSFTDFQNRIAAL